MRKPVDLWITNLITSEVEVVHNFDDVIYFNDSELTGRYLFIFLKPYLDNQTPIKLELVVK